MPGLNGLEVEETWRVEGELPAIVFVTAYDQYAVEAFRLHALDYLTKPIDPRRFVRVHRSWVVNVEKVREAQPLTKRSWVLVTRSGLEIPVGPQYHDALKKILE
jgi:DNA-binding LytR/AlgR family response regulator